MEYNDNNEQKYTSRTQKYHSAPAPKKEKKTRVYTPPEAEEACSAEEQGEASLSGEAAPRRLYNSDETRVFTKEDMEQVALRTQSSAQKSVSPRAWIIAVCIIAAAVVIVNLFVIGIVKMDGDSMSPTLAESETVLVNKVGRYFSFPKKNDIVYTEFPGYSGYYIKRVIAYPGESVEIQGGVLYVDNEAITETYADKTAEYPDMERLVVPEGSVFVLGDNRASSLDSRSEAVGCIPSECIKGTVAAVIFPFGNMRLI